MNAETKILIVEHDAWDLELMQYELKKGGINYISEAVESEKDYENALKRFNPDIILSDYSLPEFDGAAAFKMRQRLVPETPFIFVSGTIGEENSIEYIKNGLTDYTLKERLFTLPTKVKRALKDALEQKEKNKTEQERIQNEKRLAHAQQVAHMGSWEVDLATNITIWSDENCRIFGLSPAENRQSLQSFLSFVHPEDLDYVTKTLSDSHASFRNNSFYHRIIRKDGAVRHIHSETLFEFDEQGNPKGLSGICHDITKVKEIEAELHKSEANLQTIFKTTDVGFLLMDTGFNILSVNAVLNRWSKGIFGHNFTKGMDLKEVLEPERLAQFDAMRAAIIQDGQVVYESKFTDAQGNLNWFIVNGKRVIDKTPKVIGICLSVHDITIRKQAEEQIKELNASLEDRVLERTLELTESNKALEAFSYSVSHDLRAPVRAVMSFTKIIQKDYSDKMEPELRELFNYIENGSTRMMDIITDLLKLAKYGKEKLKFEPVNMGQLVKSIWSNISRANPHHATMELAELPVVRVDMSMMEQVIINLISNAIKYSSKKEKPVVAIWYEQTEENLTFYFQDNGVGFDMKNYDRLFGAFQRLHSANEFEGTGVGLTLVKSIIEKHGGTVGAEAKVGEGATFYFTLPLQ